VQLRYVLSFILGGGLGGGSGQQIPIISYDSENAGDGNYRYSYETGNGITVQETGHRQGKKLHFYFDELFVDKLFMYNYLIAEMTVYFGLEFC